MDEYEIIHLNKETKINQILESPMVLSEKETEHFYFDYLCYLCGRYKDRKKLYDEYNENKLKKSIFYIKSQSMLGFEYAVKKFVKILFDDKNKDYENQKQDFLSNYIIVFKPGFILDSLIKDKPFVLKDISNLHSDVLERDKKISLIEDIYNTFTSDNNKEITFSTSNRVLATANDGYENKLSEAILSRFTIINVENYK